MSTYGQAALCVEIPEVGQKEWPETPTKKPNTGPRVYMFGQPWCARFQTWALKQVGFDPAGRWNSDYVPSWVDAARKGIAGMRVLGPGERPQAGDLACYDWERDGVADHIGDIESIQSVMNFMAVEGNTSLNSDSNGGAVMRRARDRSQTIAIIRLPEIPKLTLKERIQHTGIFGPSTISTILARLKKGYQGTAPNPNDSHLFRALRGQGIGAASSRKIIKSLRRN